MKQVKFTLITIVLFCTLFLVSSFQSRDNFNAEEIKYSTIHFGNMTNSVGMSYVFELLNYNCNYNLGKYYSSGSKGGYIILANPDDDAFQFMLTMIQFAAQLGWDVGDFNFACTSYFGSDTVVHYVQGTYSPLKIEKYF